MTSTWASAEALIPKPSVPQTPMPSRAAEHFAVHLGQPFDHEDIGPVPGRMHPVFNVMPLVQVERREPGILMEPARVFATAAFGSHDRPQFVALCRRQPDLVVTRRMVLRIGQHPYLQEFHGLRVAGVHLAVRNARPGRHDLNLPRTQLLHVPHAVAVAERTFERNRHDLHVIVGMRPESFARGDRIVVEHPQGAEMDSPGVVISGKTERMVGIEPTMVGVSARLCAVNRLIHSNDFLLYNRLGVKQTPRQPRLRAAPDGIRRLHLQKDVLSVKEIEKQPADGHIAGTIDHGGKRSGHFDATPPRKKSDIRPKPTIRWAR